MYGNMHQAETTGVVIGRRQGYKQGYEEGWQAAMDAAQQKIAELEAALNSFFVIAYPALTTIHHSDDRAVQNFFVQQYTDAYKQNVHLLKNVPHQDPYVTQYSHEIPETINRWMANAAQNTHEETPAP